MTIPNGVVTLTMILEGRFARDREGDGLRNRGHQEALLVAMWQGRTLPFVLLLKSRFS